MSDLHVRRWFSHFVPMGAAAVLLAGCGGGSNPSSEMPPSPNLSAPTQSSNRPEKDERAAVETAYTAFWSRSFHADDKPVDAWHEEIAAVAVDPQLTTTLDAMHYQQQAGITVYGDVTARITSVDIDGEGAKVVDCQDASRTGQADAQTGDPKTVGVPRNPVNADLVRVGPGGLWKVARVSFPGGTC